MRDCHLEKIVYAWDQLSYLDKTRMMLCLRYHIFMLLIINLIKTMKIWIAYEATRLSVATINPAKPVGKQIEEKY